ncbi:hypothetical protein Tco_0184199 [Tanacetum coccineum]
MASCFPRGRPPNACNRRYGTMVTTYLYDTLIQYQMWKLTEVHVLKGPYPPMLCHNNQCSCNRGILQPSSEHTKVEIVMNSGLLKTELILNTEKEVHKLDGVSYHKLFDILKQYQKEVNELRAERMAKNANPLALVSTAQILQDTYYQSSKSHKSYAPTSKASLPPKSHATTRYKGKEIAKPITRPPCWSASKEDSDPEQAQRDKDMQKNLALIAKYFKKIYKPTNNNLRTSSNTRNKNVDTTPRYKNDNLTGQFGNQRAVNVVGARETVGGQVVQQSGNTAGFNMQGIWSIMLRNTESQTTRMKKFDEHELDALTVTWKRPGIETGDSNVIPDSLDMCDNDIQDDQNDVECDYERVALANLNANLKLHVDENKKIQKQLKKANATLTQELTECKSILAKTSRTLREYNSIRLKINRLSLRGTRPLMIV